MRKSMLFDEVQDLMHNTLIIIPTLIDDRLM